jgi:two-component system sensor histidine kinase KdpD
VASSAPQAVGEHLLALIEPYPGAQRLGGELDLLWVKPPGAAPSAEQDRSLAALRQLASVLGATLLVEESDDVVEAVAHVVKDRGTTYVMMGRPRRPRGLARLRRPLAQRIMERLPGVDIRIVADRSQRAEEPEP